MNLNPTIRLARQLAQTVRERSALIYNGSKMTDLEVMRLDKKATVLAADLEAAFVEPQPVQSWTPHNQRNSIPKREGVEL